MSDPISSKEKVLKKLRKALLQKDIFFNPDLDFDTDVFVKEEGSLAEVFSKNAAAASARTIFCRNSWHFMDMFLSLAESRGWINIACMQENLQGMLAHCEFPYSFNVDELKEADADISGCEALIARTGSVLISSFNNKSRVVSAYPPVHVVVAWRDQLIHGMKEQFKKKDLSTASSWSIITGPSRTSDIERTLVLGAHGPKELFVFIIDEDQP